VCRRSCFYLREVVLGDFSASRFPDALVLADIFKRRIESAEHDSKEFVPAIEKPDGVPVVVLPGRMLWDKGVREFVEAARMLRSAGVIARFVLIGAPDNGNREAISVAQLDAWTGEGSVEWWGHRRDMAAVLAGATIVVLPTYGEGLPKVLLEAASVGRAVVATDVRGCREVVRPGVNGLLVPPRDSAALAQAIERLLIAKELRARFGEAGRRIAETEFAEPVVIKQTLAVYHDLLDGRYA